ncbi:TPA: hypothetical protein DE059_01030 [Candidatus Peribacteria bacterium]|nr:hypothetical protein [Candidatus Peribacteria bacterium]
MTKLFACPRSYFAKGCLPISINVYGGNNDIGCNAIHSMNMLEFLTESKVSMSWSCLREDRDYDRRGPDY